MSGRHTGPLAVGEATGLLNEPASLEVQVAELREHVARNTAWMYAVGTSAVIVGGLAVTVAVLVLNGMLT